MSEQTAPGAEGEKPVAGAGPHAPTVGAPSAAAPDVEAIVAELEAEVERRRAAGDYPTSLLEKLDAPFHPDEGLEPPEAHVVVESARPLRSTRPIVGGMAVFCKRVQRRLLSWYIAPIAQDQTSFNLAILRDLRAVEQRLARLEGPPATTPDEPGTETPRQGDA
jgi:hypothetical protein